ncbi:unnamed protein product [Vitrella brassicaformis CCMP3155]|uniref:VWFA domain-containing protein n=2 Tax=Vitrella brassicaformis TaxID=1169539 RepID=A0A0G4GNG8_VITBC|nr:unnamed protein product [Vitrella brassicaformis CCMP3155]|eukprot:CEM31842.1 unnamed protein product [Vitrella brassicaformis CCMP3155]
MPPSTAQGGNRPSHGQSCRRDVAAPLDHGVNVGVDAADEITESQEEFEDDDTPDAGPLGVSLKLEYSALPVDQSMAVFVLCKVAKKPHTTTDDDPGDDTRDKPSPAAAAVAAADISVPRPGGAVSVSEGGGVGLDLVTVLDVSGSMSGAKLGSVQDAMRFVIGQLTDKDRLCVISFSSAARVELPFTLMTEAKKSLATTRIMRLRAEGGTSIRSGVESAIQCLQARRTHNPICAAFLLTDGKENLGYQYPSATRQLVQSCFVANRCGVYPFGFGADHDAVTLGGYAELCHTPFTYIESPSVMGESFAAALGAAKFIAFQDITLDFKATEADNSAIKAFHSDFEHRLTPGGKAGTLTLPDCAADEGRQILLEMEVPEVASSTDTEEAILTLSGRYKDVTARKIFHFAPQTLTIRRVWAPQPEGEPEEADTGENGVPAAAAAAAAAAGGGDGGERESAGAKRLLAMGIRADEEVSMARAERVAQQALTTALHDENAGRGHLLNQRIDSAVRVMERISQCSSNPAALQTYSKRFRHISSQMYPGPASSNATRRGGPRMAPMSSAPLTVQHLTAMSAQRATRDGGLIPMIPSSRTYAETYKTVSSMAGPDRHRHDRAGNGQPPVSSHTPLQHDDDNNNNNSSNNNNGAASGNNDWDSRDSNRRPPTLPSRVWRPRSSAGPAPAAAAPAAAAAAASASAGASSKDKDGGADRRDGDGGAGHEVNDGKKPPAEEQ